MRSKAYYVGLLAGGLLLIAASVWGQSAKKYWLSVSMTKTQLAGQPGSDQLKEGSIYHEAFPKVLLSVEGNNKAVLKGITMDHKNQQNEDLKWSMQNNQYQFSGGQHHYTSSYKDGMLTLTWSDTTYKKLSSGKPVEDVDPKDAPSAAQIQSEKAKGIFYYKNVAINKITFAPLDETNNNGSSIDKMREKLLENDWSFEESTAREILPSGSFHFTANHMMAEVRPLEIADIRSTCYDVVAHPGHMLWFLRSHCGREIAYFISAVDKKSITLVSYQKVDGTENEYQMVKTTLKPIFPPADKQKEDITYKLQRKWSGGVKFEYNELVGKPISPSRRSKLNERLHWITVNFADDHKATIELEGGEPSTLQWQMSDDHTVVFVHGKVDIKSVEEPEIQAHYIRKLENSTLTLDMSFPTWEVIKQIDFKRSQDDRGRGR